MNKYTAISLAAFIVLVVFAANAASAADSARSNKSTCNVAGTNYECESWSDEQYPVIDLFGEKNVPLFNASENIWNSNTNKLARLILDSNETYTLKNDEKLDLGTGYALEVKQIDIDSEKVWLEFTKDGEYVADQNISVNAGENNKTWNVTLDNVQGENNITIMKVYVNQLFAGVEDNIVRIDGIWLIDYANSTTHNIGDKIGDFTLQKIISGVDEANLGSLIFENETKFSVVCKVAGTKYGYDGWSDEQYPVIYLFGDKYVPLFNASENIWNSHVNKLAKPVLDSNETYTLEVCEKMDLGQSYALKVKQIDIEDEKVWLELTRNGKHAADKKIQVNTDSNSTWTVTLDNVQGEDNIAVMKVHIKQLFVGTEKRIVWIDGIWLLDYVNAKTINIGDQVGEYRFTRTIRGVDESNPGSLVFEKNPVADCSCSASSNLGKGVTKFADKSTKPSTSWYRTFVYLPQ